MGTSNADDDDGDYNDVAIVVIFFLVVALLVLLGWCGYGYWVSGGRDCAGGPTVLRDNPPV